MSYRDSNSLNRQNTTSQILSVQISRHRPFLVILFLCSLISALLIQGKIIKAQIINNIISEDGDGILGISSLMNATINNDVDAVNFFSKSGGFITVNQKNIGGATALHIATRNGNIEIAKILIENGANVNATDNEGWTPLMRATMSGNPGLVEMLLNHGADAIKTNSIGETAIVNAATSGCNECLKTLFSKYNFMEHLDITSLKQQINKAIVIASNKNDTNTQSILKSYLTNNQIVYSLQNQNNFPNNSSKAIVVKSLDDKTPTTQPSNKIHSEFKFNGNNTTDSDGATKSVNDKTYYRFITNQNSDNSSSTTPTTPIKKEIKFKILGKKYQDTTNQQDSQNRTVNQNLQYKFLGSATNSIKQDLNNTGGNTNANENEDNKNVNESNKNSNKKFYFKQITDHQPEHYQSQTEQQEQQPNSTTFDPAITNDQIIKTKKFIFKKSGY